MRKPQTCERCGAPLSAFAPNGLCSACLLRGGLMAEVKEEVTFLVGLRRKE